MKMRKRTRVKRVVTKIFNFGFWLDWKRLKASTNYLLYGITSLITPEKEKKSDSFKSAIKNFNISDAELLVKQRALLRLCIIMLVAASLIFIYVLYNIFWGTSAAAIISFVVMGIALVLAFRYHFWYFQIKERKLGCTIREWYRSLRGGK